MKTAKHISLPVYPKYNGRLPEELKTTIELLTESFSELIASVVSTDDISKYPEDIQLLIRKIRMYFHHNSSTNGVSSLIPKLEKYLKQV